VLLSRLSSWLGSQYWAPRSHSDMRDIAICRQAGWAMEIATESEEQPGTEERSRSEIEETYPLQLV